MNLTTKGDIVRMALRKLGVASDATLSDVEPASMEDALNDLESMVAQWMLADSGSPGIDIGYLFAPEDEAPQIDDDHGLPSYAVMPVALNLACLIDTDYGMMAPQTLINKAESGFEALVRSCARKKVPVLTYRNRVPLGSGNLLQKQLGVNYFYNKVESENVDEEDQ